MATEIKIKNVPQGYQSFITNGKHSIVGDEPIRSKGTDLGLAPTELVLSGLAMCKVATVRYIARKNNWESKIRDVSAHLEQVVKRGENGQLHTKVAIRIHIEGSLTQEQNAELVKQANACYIHRMLDGSWDIEEAEYSPNPIM